MFELLVVAAMLTMSCTFDSDMPTLMLALLVD